MSTEIPAFSTVNDPYHWNMPNENDDIFRLFAFNSTKKRV